MARSDRRTRRGAVALAALTTIIAVTTVGSGCRRWSRSKDETKVLSSPKTDAPHRRAISVPVSWSEDVTPNPAAEINAGSRAEDAFVMVICEPKSDFPSYTLERYSELTRAAVMKNLAFASMGAKASTLIGDNHAVEVELRGTFRDARLVYLHTSVELPERYCQVTGWTSEARFPKNEARIREVVRSFHEVD